MNHTYVVHIRLDYLIHCLVFLPFVTLFLGSRARISKYGSFQGILLGLALATFSESIQYWIPYRAYNINDLLANYLGIILGAFIPVFVSERILGFKPSVITKKQHSHE